jgi:hypothetical protein
MLLLLLVPCVTGFGIQSFENWANSYFSHGISKRPANKTISILFPGVPSFVDKVLFVDLREHSPLFKDMERAYFVLNRTGFGAHFTYFNDTRIIDSATDKLSVLSATYHHVKWFAACDWNDIDQVNGFDPAVSTLNSCQGINFTHGETWSPIAPLASTSTDSTVHLFQAAMASGLAAVNVTVSAFPRAGVDARIVDVDYGVTYPWSASCLAGAPNCKLVIKTHVLTYFQCNTSDDGVSLVCNDTTIDPRAAGFFGWSATVTTDAGCTCTVNTTRVRLATMNETLEDPGRDSDPWAHRWVAYHTVNCPSTCNSGLPPTTISWDPTGSAASSLDCGNGMACPSPASSLRLNFVLFALVAGFLALCPV